MTAQFEFHLDFNQLFVCTFFFFSYEPWHSLRPQNRSGRRRRRRSRRRNKRRKRNPSGEIQVTPKRENGRNVFNVVRDGVLKRKRSENGRLVGTGGDQVVKVKSASFSRRGSRHFFLVVVSHTRTIKAKGKKNERR